jgi:excisionase family DNA binding protein
MPSAVRCPSCGYALFTIDNPPSPVPMPAQASVAVPVPNAPLLLRVPEAAELLRISRSTLYQLIARGEVSIVRIGRTVRVSRRELERLAGAGVVMGRDTHRPTFLR